MQTLFKIGQIREPLNELLQSWERSRWQSRWGGSLVWSKEAWEEEGGDENGRSHGGGRVGACWAEVVARQAGQQEQTCVNGCFQPIPNQWYPPALPPHQFSSQLSGRSSNNRSHQCCAAEQKCARRKVGWRANQQPVSPNISAKI